VIRGTKIFSGPDSLFRQGADLGPIGDGEDSFMANVSDDDARIICGYRQNLYAASSPPAASATARTSSRVTSV
jgi:hypothetical protein